MEIPCPEECPYLHGEHDPRWEHAGRQMDDMRFLSNFAGLPRERVPVLVFVHALLIGARRNLAAELSDADLAVVVSTLARTFDTLSKGVVYEHQSEDLRLQAVITRLGESLARRQELRSAPPSSDADVLAVLQTIQSAIETHQKQAESQKSYLDSAESVFRVALAKPPEPEAPGQPEGGRLIVEP
ncbi:MAG: hypothetical protein V3V11_05215 [Vicinamibacteria bacterium]